MEAVALIMLPTGVGGDKDEWTVYNLTWKATVYSLEG